MFALYHVTTKKKTKRNRRFFFVVIKQKLNRSGLISLVCWHVIQSFYSETEPFTHSKWQKDRKNVNNFQNC